MTTSTDSPLTVSSVIPCNGSPVQVEYLGSFDVVYGGGTLFLAGDLLMVISGPVHKSDTVTTLFRRHESDGIFRYVGSVDMGVRDEKITISPCGEFDHVGWIRPEGTGSSMECEIPSLKFWISAEFRFKK